MKKSINNKGITLIALVITIIVLLILAGVAISMLAGDNGILRQAADAKAKTNQASIEEQIKLAATAAITNEEHKIKNIQEELDKQFGTGKTIATQIDGGYKVTVDGITQIITESGTVRNETEVEKNVGKEITGNKVTLTDENGEKIVVPAGFTIKEGESTQVKDGIVVVAPDESEFVWVPVEDINKMVMCQGRTTTSECKLEKENDKIVCKTHNKPLCGKLYTTDHGNTFNSSLTTQTYNANSVRREPAILTSTTSGDAVSGDDTKGINLIAAKVTDIKELVENTENSIDLTTTEGQTEVLNAWKEMLQEEFDEMIKSVEENKGFYVGRYENSLTDDKTKIQSKKNKPSATANTTETQTWYGLYQANKEYSEKNGLIDVVGSSMIWGNQYDQIMIWMQKNGYTVTSVNSSDLKGATKNTTQTTGKEGDKDILNNVYDLLGCNLEWTLEAYTIHSRAIRRRLLPQRQISFESFQQRSILYS